MAVLQAIANASAPPDEVMAGGWTMAVVCDSRLQSETHDLRLRSYKDAPEVLGCGSDVVKSDYPFARVDFTWPVDAAAPIVPRARLGVARTHAC